MRTRSLMLLIAAAFLSLTACKKDVAGGGAGGGKAIDPLVLGKWSWYSFYTRLFDEAGTEYETPPPFLYGSDDYVYDYKDNGTYNTITNDGYNLPGTWGIKNGKLVQDGTTEYEYSFTDNNHTLILKKVVYYQNNGTKFRKEEYSTLIRN